jgi:hypothetical protein
MFPGLTMFSGRSVIVRPGGGTPDHRLVPFLETLPSVVILLDLHFPFMLFMPFLEFGHGCSLVEKVQFHTTEEMLQVKNTLERQDLTNGVGRLRSFV